MRTLFTVSSPPTMLDLPVETSLVWADFWVRSQFTAALKVLADTNAPPLHVYPYISRKIHIPAIGKEGTVRFKSNSGRSIDMFILRIRYTPKEVLTIFELISNAIHPEGDAGFFLSIERDG